MRARTRVSNAPDSVLTKQANAERVLGNHETHRYLTSQTRSALGPFALATATAGADPS
jgi:hypothetical protein